MDDETQAVVAPPPTLAKTYEDWLANQLSDRTRRAYASDVRQFQRWLAATWGIEDLRLVEHQHVIEYRNFMKSEGRQNATIARKLASLTTLYDQAVLAGVVRTNPATAKVVKRYKVSSESPRHALERAQVRDLLKQPDRTTIVGLRDYAILCVLLYDGLRRAEVTALTIGSLGMERSHHTLRVVGKGEKVRVLVLPPRTYEAILAYLTADGREKAAPETPLFLPTTNNRTKTLAKPLTDDSIWRIVKKYARMADIPEKTVTTHVLRHTAATTALDNGSTPRRVQYFLGHADLTTTMRYDSHRGDLDDSAAHKIDYGA